MRRYKTQTRPGLVAL